MAKAYCSSQEKFLGRLQQDQAHTGQGDVALGLKYRFSDPPEEQWWPSLGTQAFVKVPVAETPTGSERVDIGVLVLASQPLPWRLSLDVNAGHVAVGQLRPHGYLLEALASASRELMGHLSSFVELFFASRAMRDERDTPGLDTGMIYLLTRRVSLKKSGSECRLIKSSSRWASDARAGLSWIACVNHCNASSFSPTCA